tara:strand:- start:2345 stop:2953 length:609 start_codon:yes stop_codon:yes gene_type:complete
MSRLITLGCSHTYCEGVSNTSSESWPSILSNKLDKKLINLGSPGSSNRAIQHNVINFTFELDDTVIILWTYPDRYHFFLDKEKDTGLINIWGKGRSEAWFRDFHTDYNEKFDNKTIVNQVNLFLKSKRVNVVNLLVSSEFNYYFDITNLNTINSTLVTYDIDFTKDYLEKYPRGIDNWHMGVEGNYNYAMSIYNSMGTKPVI